MAHVRWHPEAVTSLYDAVGGQEALLRLAEAWHVRVLADPVVSHAFHRGFNEQHTVRLAAYWAEALGGPPLFTQAYGDETTVVRMHSGEGEHEEMDHRAIACFDAAMADIGIEDTDPLRTVLHHYFAWATTESMGRYPDSEDDVPDGLDVPQWTWDGLDT